MKKILLVIFALTLGWGLKAQCPLTQAVDFTARDVHGTEVRLFDILDGGQYVLIDFFFTSCGPCQQACPKVVQAYTALGCNMHDVFFMEIDTGDSEAACLNWVNTYGVEYPTISGAAGGTSICSTYRISSYPTIILIAPDRSIVIRDLWPINNAQTIVNALGNHGIEPHDCSTMEDLVITPDTLSITISDIFEYGSLTISNPNDEEVIIHSFTAEPIFFLQCWHGTEDVTNGMTIAANETVEITVRVDVPVKEIFTGKMYISTSAGDYEVNIVLDFSVDVDENEKTSLTLFPNPTNDFATLKGESLGTVSVYNALGQKVDEFHAGSNELNLNTANYEDGVYVIKTEDEKVVRLVIKH